MIDAKWTEATLSQSKKNRSGFKLSRDVFNLFWSGVENLLFKILRLNPGKFSKAALASAGASSSE